MAKVKYFLKVRYINTFILALTLEFVILRGGRCYIIK
jgi:hypothetical protein